MERALGDELDGLLVVGPGRGHRCCDRCGGGLRAGRAALAVGRDRAGGRGWRLLEVLVSGEWRLPALPRSAHVVCGLKNMLLSATHLDAAVLAVPKDTAFHAAFGLSSGFFGPGSPCEHRRWTNRNHLPARYRGAGTFRGQAFAISCCTGQWWAPAARNAIQVAQ